MLNILADENIPGLDQLAQHANLVRLPGRQICSDDLVGVDAMLIRSITTVDAQLLARAATLKFIGTATIGTDHVDQQLLQQLGIYFASAAGCNANAVVDYVLASLFELYDPEALLDKSVGIVGCGNVGSRLIAALEALGMRCKVYDPHVETTRFSHSFDEVCACDILSLHVPLVTEGEFPTIGLISKSTKQLDKQSTIVNTSRGEVIEAGLLDSPASSCANMVCDVWHDEPQVNPRHVLKCAIATPHIAGHSRAGKLRGSKVILQALERYMDIGLFSAGYPDLDFEDSDWVIPFTANTLEELAQQIQFMQLNKLTQGMRRLFASARSDAGSALAFDTQRRRYIQRPEINYTDLMSSKQRAALMNRYD